MSVKVKKSKETKDVSPAKESGGTSLAERVVQHPLLSLREEVDRLFDDFFSGFSLGPFGRHAFDLEPFRKIESRLPSFSGFFPRMDVGETDAEYTLTAELPGMDEKDIEITLSNGVVSIEGEKKEEKEEKKKDYRLMERHYGSISRSYRLPEEVNEDKAEATFEKGILVIKIPKTKSTKKMKKVKIRSG
ncbi:MAG: Hsp20/alpha crystallin family protein [Rhodospirillales bacterium]|nr:Hsp20/alpha crystallin family protein [Rhodospirillales bacterium]